MNSRRDKTETKHNFIPGLSKINQNIIIMIFIESLLFLIRSEDLPMGPATRIEASGLNGDSKFAITFMYVGISLF